MIAVSPECGYQFRTIPSYPIRLGTVGVFMKAWLVFGIISLVAAGILSCAAGVYAATNPLAALGTAGVACFALMVGIKWIAACR